MKTYRAYLLTGLLLTGAALSAEAGTFFSDFNTGALPPGSHTNANTVGGAFLELSGGVGDSGCLKITKNVNSENGSFVLDDLDAGQPIYGFDMTFNIRIGGGTAGNPADGFSFVVAPDLTDTSLWSETGIGGGLRFTWDDNAGSGQTPPDPAIRVRVGAAGTIVAWKGYTVASMETGGTDASTWWSTCHIRLNPDGSLNFDYKGANVFTNFFIPHYQDFVNLGLPMRFGVGGRTGGRNENFWFDNLSITTYTNSMVGISQQPFSQTAQQGDDIAFDVRVANTNGVTYQWYSNNVLVAGAASPTLTIPNVQPATSGSKYKAVATGPNNAVTSTEATLTVTNLSLPSTPQLAFNFDDGAIPTGVTPVGVAIVDTFGGITNSGCAKLVNPAGSGILLISDPAPAAPLYGFTARFKILVGGGTIPPADGFAFAFGSDIPDAPSGNFEEGIGLGNGLRVSFDIYDNNGIFGYTSAGEPQTAPSIDVRYGGTVLATKQLPLSFMETGLNDDGTPAYKDAIIQLNADATLNVVYHGALVFDHLSIPAFSSFGQSTNASGSRFAIGARTGSLNDNIWLDNLELTTVTSPGAVRLTQSPTNQTILVGHSLTNTVTLNDTAGVTYQMYRNGTNLVSGATDGVYVFPSVAVTDSGATFSVQATKASVTVTSAPATLTVCNLTAPTSPNYVFTFDDGLVPANTALYSAAGGGGYITANGGVGDSGVLHITDAVGNESGALVISNLYGGAQVSAIAASWSVREGGGSATPADGYSFNFANNLTQGVSGGENGNGSGISVGFDLYGSATDNPPAPNCNIRYKGALVSSTYLPRPQLETDTNFVTVLLRVDADGKLYLSFGERVLYNGLQLPNYAFTTSGQFGFYGRTGGSYENQWLDNINLQGTRSSGPLAIIVQPASALVMVGSNATFTVTVSDPNNVTYQWSKNGANLSGATTSSYTTPATTLADNGALFKVVATSPSGTATSSNAVLAVVAPITVSNPIIAYDFNDFVQPPNTILNGNGGGGYISSDNTSTNGVLHLTDAAGSQGGTFIMPDLNANAPVKGLTAHFSVRVADGSATPADGFSFVWAPSNDIPNSIVFGQSGIGSGLIVGFDTYVNNNPPEAPSFNIWYHGAPVITKLVPLSAIYTGNDPGDQFADVFIRVNTNGTVDLQYKGQPVFNQVPLPGFAALLGGEFAIGAGTGASYEAQWVDNVQIATTVGLVPIPIRFGRLGADLRLTWGDGFKLQSTPSLSPPVTWSDVPNAASPFVATNNVAAQFYRLAPAQ